MALRPIRALNYGIVLVLLAGCGGTTGAPTHTHGPGPLSGSSTGNPTGSSGAPTATATFGRFNPDPAPSVVMTGSGPADAAPSCEPVDASRPATPAENAQLCICTAVPFGTEWQCYGPSPGMPKPNPACTTLGGNGVGTTDGSCLAVWTGCSDSHDYAVSCADRECECLVSGLPGAQLAPRDSCPESKDDFNALCGWALQ